MTASLVCTPCTEAIDFYVRAFGAEEIEPRMTGPDGSVGHAEIRIGDSTIMLGDASEGMLRPGFVYVHVPDARESFDKAVAAGAHVLAQDEATSVVWGMPRAVAKAGLCSAVLPLEELATAVQKLIVRNAA